MKAKRISKLNFELCLDTGEEIEVDIFGTIEGANYPATQEYPGESEYTEIGSIMYQDKDITGDLSVKELMQCQEALDLELED
jgi:hypothetical protein